MPDFKVGDYVIWDFENYFLKVVFESYFLKVVAVTDSKWLKVQNRNGKIFEVEAEKVKPYIVSKPFEGWV